MSVSDGFMLEIQSWLTWEIDMRKTESLTQVSAASDFLDCYANELVLSVTNDDIKSVGIDKIAQDVANKGFTAVCVSNCEKGFELNQIDL